MEIKLYNSLTGKKEIFTPIEEGKVGMYVCGPTVYSRAHLGNARSVVVYDILYRLLSHKYDKNNVKYVRNITDVDDKINKAAAERGVTIQSITEQTTKWFHEDMEVLGCLPPTIEPKATEHINEIIEMIQKLLDKNIAYEADGHVYFNVLKAKDYGKLSGKKLEDLNAGARIEVNQNKLNSGDFVLWKPSNDGEPSWNAKFGAGRPGWHIECSAMSNKHLGGTFDIHGGGADLKFPHHENEIAQSTCAVGGNYANYWVHNGFLMVEGEKMSKSLGNFFTVNELIDNIAQKIPTKSKEIAGHIIRYIFLSTHYRKPLDWTEKKITDAVKKFEGFYKKISTDNKLHIAGLEDDMNLAIIFANKALNSYTLEFLGLLPKGAKESDFFGEAKDVDMNVINEWKQAKANKDWAKADQIRSDLAAQNINVNDYS